jgi:hypothetical protein
MAFSPPCRWSDFPLQAASNNTAVSDIANKQILFFMVYTPCKSR